MQTIMRTLVSVLTVLLVASCGGGGGGGFTQGGSSNSSGSTTVSTLSVQIQDTTLPADGVSTTNVTITAMSGAVAVKDATISVTTGPLGTLSAATVITNESGIATVTLTAASAAGVATITAKSGSVTKTDSITFAPLVDKFGLSASQYAVHTDNSDSSIIRATVLDSNSAVVDGATVSFTTGDSDAGQLSASSAVTGEAFEGEPIEPGVAKIRFSAGVVERSNQVVTLSATVNGITKMVPIQIIGTTVTMSPESNSVAADGSDQISVPMLVQDFGDHPIFDVPVCLEVDTSGGGNLALYEATGTTALTTACPIAGVTGVSAGNTGSDGRLTVVVKGSSAGTATLKVTSQGATASADFGVSAVADVFAITAPAKTPTPALTTDTTQAITVSAPGATTVRLATSLGTWVSNGTTVVEVPVGAGNLASAVLQSSIAGTANVVAYDVDNTLRSDSIQIIFSAPATEAAQILLNSSQRVLPVSTGTISYTYTATLTAEVLTSDDQPVSGAAISFSLVNSTGGGEFMSPPFAITDEFGVATVTFTSGTKASTHDGVKVLATVLNKVPALTAEYDITITDKAGSVVIGRSTEVASTSDGTAYQLPMSVLVTNVNGNPVVNSEVNLSVWPTYYRTGVRDLIDNDNIGNGVAVQSDIFPNEDANENLILGATEDFDGNGVITPPNSAGGSLPRVVTTDSNGLASFNLTYLKQNADWVVSRIRASTRVSGTEIVSELEMTLPPSKVDACGGSSCLDVGDAGTLPDSPFNSSCPFSVTASEQVVYVPKGGTNTVEMTLAGPGIVGRPVTTLVDSNQISGTLNATATQGFTDASGKFVSTLTASDLDAQNGDFATIYYFGSCAATVVRLVVGDVPATPNSITLDVSDNYLPLNGTTEVTATVLDASGTPVSGALVGFSVSTNNTGGKLSLVTETTDQTGRATVTYTSGGTTGTDSISASVIGTSPALTATPVDITVDPAAATVRSVAVTTGAASIPAGQTDIPVAIRATVLDTDGKAVEGVTVRFKTTAGSFSSTVTDLVEDVTTHTDGTADVLLYAGNQVGTAMVTAVVNGFSGTGVVSFTAGAPSAIALLATPDTQRPGGTSQLKATVMDASGNPVAGELVSFAIMPAGSTNPALSAFTATTDDNGQASITYTAGTASTSVTDVVTATTVNAVSTTESITVDPAAHLVGSIALESGASTLTADGVSETTIRSTVRDTDGVLMEGVTVDFVTTAGTLLPASAVTNADGVAQVTLKSSITQGTATVTADADGYLANVSVTFTPGAAASILMYVAPSTVNTGGSFDLSLAVEDGNGNRLTGEHVTMRLFKESDPVGAPGNFDTLLDSAANATDDTGVLHYTWTAAQAYAVASGDDIQVVVTTTNGTQATKLVRVDDTVAIVGGVTVTSGATQLVADNASTTSIRATVVDVVGNPIIGRSVSFTTTAGTLLSSTDTTDGSGLAEVTLKAGAALGTATVTATVGGYHAEVLVTLVAGAPVTVTVTPAPSTVNPLGTSTVSAQVVDANALPVAGETVRFELSTNASGGSIAVSAVTNANGVATVSYTAGSVTGNDIIKATAQSNSVSGNGTVIVSATAQVVGGIAITTGTSQLTASTASKTLVRVSVTDTSGAAVTSQPVTLSTTLGSLLESDGTTAYGTNAPYTTNAAGEVEFYLQGAATLGTASVSAVASGFIVSTDVAFVAGAPVTVTVTPAPSTVNPLGTSTVSAQVVDANALPVAGETVRFELSTNTSGGSIAVSAVTNANGVATVSYTAGSMTGNDIIKATAQSNSVSGNGTVIVSATAQVVGGIAITTGTSQLTASTASKTLIRVSVTDTTGAPVAAQPVTLSTTLGSLLESDGTTAYGTNAPYTTNAAGEVEFYLQGAATLGTASVSAVASGFIVSTDVAFVAGAPVTVTVTPAPSTVNPLGTSTVSAQVVDANALPVAGETVRFELSTNTSGGSIAVSAVTNANGVATVSYTAGSVTGSDTVKATAQSNSVFGTATVTVDATAQVVASITLEAGSSTLTADNGTSKTAIRATVLDASGAPVQGRTVTFATTAGTLPVATDATDANGIAEVLLNSAANLGTATVTANADNFLANVTVTFIAGPADSVTVLATPDSLKSAETSVIVATVLDANANPVTGETVTFAFGAMGSTNPSLSAATAVTDASGKASVTYTAGTLSATATDTINAETTNGKTGSDIVTVEPDATVTPGSFSLATDSYTVKSDNSNSSTITATVLDVNNAVLSGVTVTFSAAGGQLSASSVVSDANGDAVVTFSSGTSDKSNRNVLVTAKVSGLTNETITIAVTGSTVAMSATDSTLLPLGGDSATLTITAKDASGQVVPGTAITLQQNGAGTVTFTGGDSGTTDLNGQFSTTIAGNAVGDVTITASGLGATTTTVINVAAAVDAFTITSPVTDTVNLSTGGGADGQQDIVIQVPTTNVISVATTLGVLHTVPCASLPGGTSGSLITVDPGIATSVTVCLETTNDAGTATIRAADTVSGDNDSITVNVAAPCSQADTLVLQAGNTSLQVSDATTTHQTTITASLVTSLATGNQPVRGCPIQFRIKSNATGSGEQVSPVLGITDSSGKVTTAFTSGSAGSVPAGVEIEGEAYQADYTSFGAPITNTVNIVVTDNAGSVSVGRGTVISDYNTSTYKLPMSVVVTNAAGQTVEGASVTLKVWPKQFSTGYWLLTGTECAAVVTGTFDNEDANKNLRLDAGEDTEINEATATTDYNGDGDQADIYPQDGLLTPHNADGGGIPQTVTTDASGVAEFDLLYLKAHSVWIVDEVEATTVVNGTEMRSTLTMRLPSEATDAKGCLLPNSSFNPY